MPTHVIEKLRQATTALVSEQLKSRAMVIHRLCGLIEEARALGHSHKTVHDVLRTSGLDLDFNSYRVSLTRARRAHEEKSMAADVAAATGSGTPGAALLLPVSTPPSQGSATWVKDALVAARAAGDKDYARVARDHFRKNP